MKLNCVCLFLALACASTNASYTHQESSEDEKSTFNVVSTLAGGIESNRRHVSTNLELEPSYPYSAAQQSFGNAVSAPYRHHYHHQHHHGHNYPHGAHCTHPDLTSVDSQSGHDVADDVDNPRGHERLFDPVSGAGFLDVRNGVKINSRTATGGQNRPLTYPQETPSYPPAYPPPHVNYPPTDQNYHPSYPTPMHTYNYPNYPAPYYPNYPAPPPPPGAYQNGGNHDHVNQHNHQHPGPYSHGYGGPRDHWDHSFKMSTEYKEDGVHNGPTHALTNNGYGFGSGYGGGYNGAFNRPGF